MICERVQLGKYLPSAACSLAISFFGGAGDLFLRLIPIWNGRRPRWGSVPIFANFCCTFGAESLAKRSQSKKKKVKRKKKNMIETWEKRKPEQLFNLIWFIFYFNLNLIRNDSEVQLGEKGADRVDRTYQFSLNIGYLYWSPTERKVKANDVSKEFKLQLGFKFSLKSQLNSRVVSRTNKQSSEHGFSGQAGYLSARRHKY